jgi:hypothetical protein
MMKFFMLEWFHPVEQKYKQEYFQTMDGLAARYKMLTEDVEGSSPEVTTVHFED